MSYLPKPIDTSGIQLDPRIEALGECLAEHAHDVWAKHRIAEGWVFGPAQDDSLRRSPRLVPFAELSEGDKDFDRRAALEPIKALVSLGWRIVAPEPGAAPAMEDPITEARRAWETEIEPVFLRVDREAQNIQRAHKICTIAAAIAGTTAVVLAIIQLSGSTARLTLVGELAAALIALIAVTLGVVSTLLPRWLLSRHKAEQLRSMKFQLLVDSDLWSGDPSRARARLDRVAADVAHVVASSGHQLHDWAVETMPPSLMSGGSAPPLDRVAVDSLADHYVKTRIVQQKNFFHDRYHRLTRLDLPTRMFPSLVFFSSVLLALFHFVFHLLAHYYADHGATSTAQSLRAIGRVCTILSASLPVAGAGVRTLRTAFEYGRNKLRYLAAYKALTRLADRLGTRDRGSLDAQILFRDLAYCEQILESERREWLRLMMEAEWYG